MLFRSQETAFVLPNKKNGKGTSFEGHEFFEAPSIRKIGDVYYMIYSSVVMHELCYATSTSPDKEFTYQGVIISNNDLHIDTYKPAEKPMYFGGNNHGSIVHILNDWYIFYHRHTNGSNFSRQGCLEKIDVDENGMISQVEMTSCGPNGGPLDAKGEFPAYIACNLFHRDEAIYTGDLWMDSQYPKITQDGKDGDQEQGYIMNMTDSSTAGFKYFDFKDTKSVTLKVRGYSKGVFEIKTRWNGEVLGEIPVDFTNVWTDYTGKVDISDGVHALYITYRGEGRPSLYSFTLH